MPSNIKEVHGIIYSITCTVNDKVYIGQTLSHRYTTKNIWVPTGIYTRWLRHLSNVDSISDKHKPLYNDITKYGEDAFEIEEIRKVKGKNIADLDNVEIECIKEYNSIYPNGYNIVKGGGVMSKSREILMNHYGIERVLHKPVENDNRKERSRQLTMKITDLPKILDYKEVESARLIPAERKGEFAGGKLILKFVGDKDSYKIAAFKKTFEDSLNHLKRIADQNHIEYEVDPRISATENIIETSYKYLKDIEKFAVRSYRKVSGSPYWHKQLGKDIYIVFLFSDEYKGKMRKQFGGRNMDIFDAYKEAKRFVRKLSKQTEIATIDLNIPPEPDSNSESDSA